MAKIKRIELPGQLKKLPKHLKIILSGFGLAIVGVLMYYLSTASPMFGQAAPPTVFADGASNVTKHTADLAGVISNDDNEVITAQGIEFGLTPSYGTTLTQDHNGTNNFSLEATYLECNTTYHYRAFITSGSNIYGGDDDFTTASCEVTPEEPSASTISASSIAQTSATLNGDISQDGSAELAERGFRYGTTDSYGQTVTDPVTSSITFDSQWGTAGSGDSQFNTGQFIKTDSLGNIYVSDSGNSRIQKFDSNGNYLLQWGTNGTGNGQFDGTGGIAIDSSNNVYVADIGNSRIQKFNSSGTYITKWGSTGTGNSQFSYMAGLAVDASDNIYSADIGNSRIQKFNSSGTYITK